MESESSNHERRTCLPWGLLRFATRMPWYFRVLQFNIVLEAYPPNPFVSSHSQFSDFSRLEQETLSMVNCDMNNILWNMEKIRFRLLSVQMFHFEGTERLRNPCPDRREGSLRFLPAGKTTQRELTLYEFDKERIIF
jgi:hypothetical protein